MSYAPTLHFRFEACLLPSVRSSANVKNHGESSHYLGTLFPCKAPIPSSAPLRDQRVGGLLNIQGKAERETTYEQENG